MAAGWVLLVPCPITRRRVGRWIVGAHSGWRPIVTVSADPGEALALVSAGLAAGVVQPAI